MAREGNVEYNPETAQDLRPKSFRFDALGYVFRFRLEIPEYILHRLTTDVMDKLYDHMSAHCREVVTDAIRGGYLYSDQGEKTMRANVGSHLKNYIWERFSITQEKEGCERFQTAPSLQRVHV